jgi:hypothetical protein
MMLEIPAFILREIVEEIDTKFEEIYNKYVYPKKNIEFKEYRNGILDEIIKELRNLSEVTNEIILPIKLRIDKTKKRWLAKELEGGEDTAFYKEIEVFAKKMYEDYGIEKFKAFYGYDSYEELRQNTIDELEKWAKDDDSPLSHFLFIKEKKKSQIERAIYNDIKYFLLKTVKEKCPRGGRDAIYSTPISITHIPIDHTNMVKVKSSSFVPMGNDEYLIDTYYIDDNRVFESYINVEYLQEDLLRKKLKILNVNDLKILSYVMSVGDEHFYLTREVTLEIGDIVRNVFESDGQKNYIAVKESLIKMATLEARIVDSSLRTISVRIFDKADIYVSSDTNREVARIIVSTNLFNEYVKNRTINLYKHIIDNFSLNSSKALIFSLQRIRIGCASGAKGDEPLVFRTNLSFFRSVLYMGKRRRKHQIQIIEEALNEIISNNITLKSYERNGDVFILEFHPFSEREKIDLLNNTDPSMFLLESPKALT